MRFNVFLPRSAWRFLGPTLVFTASVGLHEERTATELRHPETLRGRMPRSTDLPTMTLLNNNHPPKNIARRMTKKVTFKYEDFP